MSSFLFPFYNVWWIVFDRFIYVISLVKILKFVHKR